MRVFFLIASLISLFYSCTKGIDRSERNGLNSGVRDLVFFLHRLRTLDHLPDLEASHLALSSTWDTTGMNNDGYGFKQIRDSVCILLDQNGPGCIHRIFTGQAYSRTHDTRLQIFADGNTVPVFDIPIYDLFDPVRSPFPYPLASNKTYPGILFPLPYEKHIKVQLYNPMGENWGNYWQVAYTTYPGQVKVESIHYPFSDRENREIREVVRAWLHAERNPPVMPANWPFKESLAIRAGEMEEINLQGSGIIRNLYITASPNVPSAWLNTRFQIYWDGTSEKSVDVPLGYFFGNADYGSLFACHSILSGITADGAYSMFPMPYGSGAKIVFQNQGMEDVELEVMMDIDQKAVLTPATGRFHATFREVLPYGKNYDSLPRFSKSPKPFFITLDQITGPGKYVGTRLHVAWPHKDIWWGEGDWLFWSDEEGFPPSYHGTGTEEYFNSGWCYFDRKAMSGYIKMRPGNVNVYSFHLNDAFHFERTFRAAVEIWWWPEEVMKSMWSSTAFWYALQPQDAGSQDGLAHPRLIHQGNIRGENGIWEDEIEKGKD